MHVMSLESDPCASVGFSFFLVAGGIHVNAPYWDCGIFQGVIVDRHLQEFLYKLYLQSKPLIGINTGSIIVLRAMHNRVYAMKNVNSLTHSNAEGHICRPFFIVYQIIVAFCCPFVLDSKVVIQKRYVQMTCGELITSTIWRIAMKMNMDNPLISLQQPNFS